MHPDRSPAPLFHLGPGALEDICEGLAEAIRAGLAGEEGGIPALPAFLPPPSPALAGRAVVVDAGGTSVRAAVVALGAGGARIEAGPVVGPLPRGRTDAPLPMEDFFGVQADLVASLSPPPGLPVGYCFSYPAAALPDGDARLLRWTKGVEVAGVVGQCVGALLGAALADRGVAVSRVRVLNDAVAALLAGEPGLGRQPVGLVVGTGTNMAILAHAVPKVPSWDGPMAVNLESGAFPPSHLNLWDEEVDEASEDPGRQRLEKALSGRYLPLLFRAAAAWPDRIPPGEGAEAVVRVRHGPPGDDADLAAAILDRSADLVGAGLAAVAGVLGGRLGVVAEGSLFWCTPGYRDRVEATASMLLGTRDRVLCAAVPGATLVGAARAALLHPGGAA
jgi:hexokinase